MRLPLPSRVLNKGIKTIAPYINDTLPQKNIFIFSDPRGGSTWLAKILKDALGYPVLWEPLYLRDKQNSAFKRLGFGWRQEIPVCAEWPEAYDAFDRIFRGKVLTNWTTTMSTPIEFILNDWQICKFCRANGMAQWLKKNFQPDLTPIILFRHPFSVAASQLKHGSWAGMPAGFDIPKMPFNERYRKHSRFLSTLSSQPERSVAQWCLTNGPLLETQEKDDFIVIFYERLLHNPAKELESAFGKWGVDIEVDFTEIAKRPSRTVISTDSVRDVEEQLSKWTVFFDKETIFSLVNILEYFEIPFYSERIWPSLP